MKVLKQFHRLSEVFFNTAGKETKTWSVMYSLVPRKENYDTTYATFTTTVYGRNITESYSSMTKGRKN